MVGERQEEMQERLLDAVTEIAAPRLFKQISAPIPQDSATIGPKHDRRSR
jgi:hypothetical protein